MLRERKNHDYELWTQMSTFYYGVTPSIQNSLDAAAGGTLFKKPQEAYDLVDDMAPNDNIHQDRQILKKQQ